MATEPRRNEHKNPELDLAIENPVVLERMDNTLVMTMSLATLKSEDGTSYEILSPVGGLGFVIFRNKPDGEFTSYCVPMTDLLVGEIIPALDKFDGVEKVRNLKNVREA